eukprot:12002064-Karenia_brevis.AAC.1
MVIDAMGMPKGLQNFIKSLYEGLYALVLSAGDFVLLAVVASGIIHGCPLAGAVFALAMGP